MAHDLAVRLESRLVDLVREAPIRREPFPHLVIDGALPPEVFEEIRSTLPPLDAFESSVYSGVRFRTGRANQPGFGYVLREPAAGTPQRDLLDALCSPAFARAGIEKFGGTVPDDGGRRECALYVDTCGYEKPPHLDRPEQILTFLLFLTPDDHRGPYGTTLLRPKPRHLPVERHRAVRATAKYLNAVAAQLHLEKSRPYWALRRSSLGERLGLLWPQMYPWSWFDVAEPTEALANRLLVFGPGPDTWHAVLLDYPDDHPHPRREVARGYVRRAL